MAFKSDGSSPVTEHAFETRQSLDLGNFAARFGGVTRLAFKSGAQLFAQGEPANCLFFIQEGQVQLTVVSSHGKEAILSVLGAGDFCGESCLSGGKARISTAVCIADTAVARLERANIVRAIREDALFAEFFIVCVLKRAFHLRDNLLSQLFDSTERRLARTLLLLANHGKNGASGSVINNLDQEALAQMIGTTRSRVNYFMNKFRRLGYIDYNGRIDVHGSLLDMVRSNDAGAKPGAGVKSSG
jgi:CRP/FNR family transcriptional regulator, cyclic AMP receptor protein